MGSSVSCSIVLNPIGKSFYWTDETISGHVILTTNRSLKIRSINVSIMGELIFEETTAGGPNTGPRTVTVRKNFYVEQHPVYITPSYGVSFDADGYYLLDANTYQLPFSVRLAKYLPPSLMFTNTSTPYIEYFMEASVDRSSFRPNIRSKIPIMVTPRVPRPPNTWSLEGEQSNFRGLHVYGKVLRHYLLIGEPYITLELTIQNPSQTTIQEIIIRLVQRRHLDRKFGRAIIFNQALSEIAYFQDTHLHRTFQVPVPSTFLLFAPTTYIAKFDKSNRSWSVDYILEVIFKTNLFLTNVTLEFPLIVVNSGNTPRTRYKHTAR